jgi:TonB family protein
MMISVLKRALPFVMTLIVGMMLGSIFGWNRPAAKSVREERFVTVTERRSSCRASRGRRAFSESTPLNITYEPNTAYTPEALKNKTTGVVQLRVRFNADGTTTVVEHLSTLPDGLTEDALRVSAQTRFEPETYNGQPVSVTKDMNYIYSLSDRAMMSLR